ncbi:MAG: hypothetical protein ABI193_17345 [Minicystis sp.]
MISSEIKPAPRHPDDNVLTTEALIAERPKDDKASVGGGHASHGHGDF